MTNDTQLQDAKTLEEYGVKDGDTLFLKQNIFSFPAMDLDGFDAYNAVFEAP